MAQAIARKIIDERKLCLTASSGGCATCDGAPASDYSAIVCEEHGLDLSAHRSCQLTVHDIAEDRVFVCMTASHERWLAALGVHEDRIYRFDEDISDPFGGDIDVYRACFDQLYGAVSKIIFRLSPDPEGVTVRDMVQDDVPKVAQLERECFSQPWSEQALCDELLLDDAVLLVAQSDDEIVGYIGMQHTGITGYITNVAVFPEFRRMGIASALIRSLMERARALGESEISLEVRSKNAGAIALYEMAGFESVGKRPRFYSQPDDDAVIMTADLG